jgi:hypothetical protein
MNSRTQCPVALAPRPPGTEGDPARPAARPRLADVHLPEHRMSNLAGLALAPVALFGRLCRANPVMAILVSALAGILALATGHENWMALLLGFAAVMLIWWDESTIPRPAGAAE